VLDNNNETIEIVHTRQTLHQTERQTTAATGLHQQQDNNT